MPSEAGSLSRMLTIYLAALNATGLEVDGNGTDDRTKAATKQAEEKDMDGVYAWGQGIKETQTARGSEER